VFFHHGCFFVHDSLELCVCLEFIPGRPPMCPLHFQTSLVAKKCAIVWQAMVMLVYCSSILIKLFHVFQAPIGQASIANLAKTISLHMSEPGGPRPDLKLIILQLCTAQKLPRLHPCHTWNDTWRKAIH
jgi:hypothetical protein